MLKLYNELATWWPLLSPLEDYDDEATFFGQLLLIAGLPPSPSLLEFGCGGGSNAFYLKKLFTDITLTDISPQMVAMSQTLNPECIHREADMRTARLEHSFDVVFIHDAIDYMTTSQDLAKAIETAFLHCKPGGITMFVPDHVRETFQPGTDEGGSDGDGRALRYFEWSYDLDESDIMYTVEYVVLLREGTQPVKVEHEQHQCGIFARAEWVRLLRDSGFLPEIVRDAYERDIFVARKPPNER